MPLIYLTRHGESPVNLSRTFSYRSIDPGLTPRGQQQAQALARYLAHRGIARIYSSPMQRAYQTALAIEQTTGAPIEVREELRELDIGSLEGRSDHEGWAIHDAVHQRWWQDDWDAAFPEGENFRRVHARVTGFLDEVVERHPTQDVAVVGHGGIFCAVLPRMCSIPWDAATPFTLGNAAVSVLRREDVLTCELWNGQAHLD